MMPERTESPRPATAPRNSLWNVVTQLLGRDWLSCGELTDEQKRVLIAFCRNDFYGIYAEVDKITEWLRVVNVYRPNRPWYGSNKNGVKREANRYSREDYHIVDLMADIKAWEAAHPLPFVELDDDDDVVTYAVVKEVPMPLELWTVYSALLERGEMKAADLAEYIGFEQGVISNLLQKLQGFMMVEMVPGHRIWRVTELSRSYLVNVVE